MEISSFGVEVRSKTLFGVLKNDIARSQLTFSFSFLGTNTILRLVRGVHEGGIFSICVLKDGSVISGGGKDGRLVLLDSELQPTGEESSIGEQYGGVRQISEGRGSQLLVGKKVD